SETASERIHPSPPDHVHSERRATLARQAFGQEVLRDPTLRISGTNSVAMGIERSRPYFNSLSAPNVRYGIKAPDHHGLRVQGVPAFPPKASKSCSESERFGCRERAVSPRTIECFPANQLAPPNPLDSCNRNLPEASIQQNYASSPGGRLRRVFCCKDQAASGYFPRDHKGIRLPEERRKLPPGRTFAK